MGSSAERHPIDEIAEEFADRFRRGETPSIAEYASRYPDLASEIREVFPALLMMEQLKPAPCDDPLDRREAPFPDRIGDYRVLREAGRGGMGIVYEAEELALGRRVALKVLTQAGLHNATYLERFRREAKAAARLHHTNIVPVFGVGEANGIHFYAMQFIHGETLDKVLHDLRLLRQSKPIAGVDTQPSAAQSLLSGELQASTPEPDAALKPASVCGTTANLSGSHSGSEYYRGVARIGLQIADALVYAHKQGILHRDIKPSNVILDLKGTAWITDFGLAKAEGTDELTQTGDVVGTVRYMAPERFTGSSLVQGDVYSLGMTLYEMLALRPAFDDSNRAQLIQRVLHDDPPAPRTYDPHIPRDLETVVLKACRADSVGRYSTAEALAEDLRRFLTDRPILARRSTSSERLRRWCRRNPAVASLLGTVAGLLVAVAVAATLVAVSLDARKREALQQLWRSKLNEARATALSCQPGQRFTSLERIREGLAIARPLGLSERDLLDFRNAAIGALALPDFKIVKEWQVIPSGSDAVAFDAELTRYVQAQADGTIAVRRVEDQQEVASFRTEGGVDGMRLSPDGGHLLISLSGRDRSGSIQVWRLAPPVPCRIYEGKGLGSHYADFSPDGSTLVFESSHQLNVLDLQSGRPHVWALDGEQIAVAVRFRPKRAEVAVCRKINGKGIVQIRDLNTGDTIAQLQKEDVNSLAWHPNGRVLAVAYRDSNSNISLWEPEMNRETATLEGHKFGGVTMLFNRAGDRLLSTDFNGMVRVWDVPSGRQLQTLTGLKLHLSTFRSDDALLATCYSVGGIQRLRLLQCARGNEVRTVVRQTSKGPGWYRAPAFNRDGTLLSVVAADPPFAQFNDIAVLSWPSGREIGRLNVPNAFPMSFDGDGALWSASITGSVLRWPCSRNGSNDILDFGFPESVVDVPFAEARALSDDRKTLILANGDRGSLIVHRERPLRFVATGAQKDVRYAAVSPDGKWVATGSHSMGAQVWEAATGKLARSFTVPGPCNVGFSPDGRWLVTGGGGTRLWHSDTWEAGPDVYSEGDSLGWAFSPDAHLLALAGQGRVRLVRPNAGVEIARFPSSEATKFEPLIFSPDGGELLIQEEDTRAIHVWDLRLIRRQLAELDLDWDEPQLRSFASPTAESQAKRVRFNGESIASDPDRLRAYRTATSVMGLAANPFDADQHFQLAQSLEAKRPAAALAHYTATLAFQPDQLLALEGRAASAFRLKLWSQVIADTTAVLSRYPDRHQTRLYRARAFQEAGRFADSIADFTVLISVWPQDMSLYRLRMANYRALGDAERAVADSRTARALTPDDGFNLNELAWKMLRGTPARFDPATALELAERAANLVPGEAVCLNTLGVAQYYNGLYAKASATLERSLALGAGQSDAFDLFYLALAHHKLGNVTQSRDCYRRAIEWRCSHGNLSLALAQELKSIEGEVEEVLEIQLH